MSNKRTLDSFFTPSSKKQKKEEPTGDEKISHSTHVEYPFSIPELPPSIAKELPSWPALPGKEINDQPDLDLLYFEPFVPSYVAKDLFKFLRSQLPFYRVEYKIKRGDVETQIRTPRYTTVFGLDDTSVFSPNGKPVDAKSQKEVPNAYSRYKPRPIPQCLDALRLSTEAATGCKFNFCLVNYYSSGTDSISFHSDDERFLGPEPTIASFSLGAKRDFLMKHKPGVEAKQLKLPLASGDMILMRRRTQSNWLHSIPKRTGKNVVDDGGRINITFRRAMVKGGTDNYYNYNVGTGPVFKWDEVAREMKVWKP
ncbi:hypothetical protein DL546_002996 [Coniochaeta pulveracea]|uniref:Fe2OG dioxygenase domain-containing protein n=1 Tax=Coniochaeta pulveracea TaxID=177199 RepID=A0A420Y2L0_9PEZI|nr:hypothetical protein DL546_002996 [Coniochaeta pulveracea]